MVALIQTSILKKKNIYVFTLIKIALTSIWEEIFTDFIFLNIRFLPVQLGQQLKLRLLLSINKKIHLHTTYLDFFKAIAL